MTERRYSDEEIATIFERAAQRHELRLRDGAADGSGALDPASGALTAGAGMTLPELQDIGREVGLPPDVVAHAALTLDRAEPTPVRRYLALPIGVGRTVPLARRLTDAEWEHLVVLLRDTFDARGRVRDDGAFKQWTNGNLQALVEPIPDGQRVRLRTTNGSALMFMNMGLGVAGLGGMLELLHALGGMPGMTEVKAGMIAVWGLALFGFGAWRLPGWARLRQKQMEAIADRLSDATARAPIDAKSLPRSPESPTDPTPEARRLERHGGS